MDTRNTGITKTGPTVYLLLMAHRHPPGTNCAEAGQCQGRTLPVCSGAYVADTREEAIGYAKAVSQSGSLCGAVLAHALMPLVPYDNGPDDQGIRFDRESPMGKMGLALASAFEFIAFSEFEGVLYGNGQPIEGKMRETYPFPLPSDHYFAGLLDTNGATMTVDPVGRLQPRAKAPRERVERKPKTDNGQAETGG